MGWRYAVPRWAVEVLMRGSPEEIAANGLVGIDADSNQLTDAHRIAAEEAGLKTPGMPMTVTQLAKALLSGVIPPETKIVSWPGDGVRDLPEADL